MGQIGDLEKSMRELEIAIQDKDAPLMVAESRMGIRQQRPRIELCRDPALHRLNQEVNEIENNIERYKLSYITDMISDQNFIKTSCTTLPVRETVERLATSATHIARRNQGQRKYSFHW